LQRFVDEVTFHASSGKGGAGSVSFRREKYVPKGGPDGGDGGRGGDVIIHVRGELRTLFHLAHLTTIRAKNGEGGSGRKRHGGDGAPAFIDVPCGSLVYDAESGSLIYDAVTNGDEFVLLKGGRGGKGNTHFATSRHQTPRFAQPGEPGSEISVRIELQLIADIGLVGKPNAGKSSLLGRLTAARPKVGAYPFTTKIPNLGVMTHYDEQRVVADIPGIIEGASGGAGLGLEFLRHVSRTRMLVYVVDAGDDPLSALAVLEEEVRDYGHGLIERPRIIVGNKVDLPGAEERLAELRAGRPGETVVGVSALTGIGIRELVSVLIDRSESET